MGFDISGSVANRPWRGYKNVVFAEDLVAPWACAAAGHAHAGVGSLANTSVVPPLRSCHRTQSRRIPLGNAQEKEFSKQEVDAQLLSLSCFQTWILDCKSILIKHLDLPAE